MKSLFVLMLCAFSLSAMAEIDVARCEDAASVAVKEEVSMEQWDVEYVKCELAPNFQVQLCEVGGSNGDGAGDKDYLVILSKNCKEVKEVRLTGEE